MKKAAHAVIILSAVALMFAIVTKMTSPIFKVGPDGFLDGASILLLFGINFTLLELLDKK